MASSSSGSETSWLTTTTYSSNYGSGNDLLDSFKAYKAVENGTGKVFIVHRYPPRFTGLQQKRQERRQKAQGDLLVEIQDGPHIIKGGPALWNKTVRPQILEIHLENYDQTLSEYMSKSYFLRGCKGNSVLVGGFYYTVLLQMAKAVDFLHKKNILHMKLNPECILYSNLKDQHFVLAGFDQAGRNPPDAADMHQKTLFRAPETHNKIATGAADIWSLGMVALDILLALPVPDNNGFSVDALLEWGWFETINETARHSGMPGLDKLLTVDPSRRTTAEAIIKSQKNQATPLRQLPVTDQLEFNFVKLQTGAGGATAARTFLETGQRYREKLLVTPPSTPPRQLVTFAAINIFNKTELTGETRHGLEEIVLDFTSFGKNSLEPEKRIIPQLPAARAMPGDIAAAATEVDKVMNKVGIREVPKPSGSNEKQTGRLGVPTRRIPDKGSEGDSRATSRTLSGVSSAMFHSASEGSFQPVSSGDNDGLVTKMQPGGSIKSVSSAEIDDLAMAIELSKMSEPRAAASERKLRGSDQPTQTTLMSRASSEKANSTEGSAVQRITPTKPDLRHRSQGQASGTALAPGVPFELRATRYARHKRRDEELQSEARRELPSKLAQVPPGKSGARELGISDRRSPSPTVSEQAAGMRVPDHRPNMTLGRRAADGLPPGFPPLPSQVKKTMFLEASSTLSAPGDIQANSNTRPPELNDRRQDTLQSAGPTLPPKQKDMAEEASSGSGSITATKLTRPGGPSQDTSSQTNGKTDTGSVAESNTNSRRIPQSDRDSAISSFTDSRNTPSASPTPKIVSQSQPRPPVIPAIIVRPNLPPPRMPPSSIGVTPDPTVYNSAGASSEARGSIVLDTEPTTSRQEGIDRLVSVTNDGRPALPPAIEEALRLIETSPDYCRPEAAAALRAASQSTQTHAHIIRQAVTIRARQNVLRNSTPAAVARDAVEQEASRRREIERLLQGLRENRGPLTPEIQEAVELLSTDPERCLEAVATMTMAAYNPVNHSMILRQAQEFREKRDALARERSREVTGAAPASSSASGGRPRSNSNLRHDAPPFLPPDRHSGSRSDGRDDPNTRPLQQWGAKRLRSGPRTVRNNTDAQLLNSLPGASAPSQVFIDQRTFHYYPFPLYQYSQPQPQLQAQAQGQPRPPHTPEFQHQGPLYPGPLFPPSHQPQTSPSPSRPNPNQTAAPTTAPRDQPTGSYRDGPFGYGSYSSRQPAPVSQGLSPQLSPEIWPQIPAPAPPQQVQQRARGQRGQESQQQSQQQRQQGPQQSQPQAQPQAQPQTQHHTQQHAQQQERAQQQAQQQAQPQAQQSPPPQQIQQQQGRPPPGHPNSVYERGPDGFLHLVYASKRDSNADKSGTASGSRRGHGNAPTPTSSTRPSGGTGTRTGTGTAQRSASAATGLSRVTTEKSFLQAVKRR